MKTKDRILASALELFNRDGVREVTLRRIAVEMGISQGNLSYHYKAKGDIVSALYYQLVGEMDAEMGKILQGQPVMRFLYQSSLSTMRTLFKYRFILKDLYKVLEADEQLGQHYRALQDLRKQQYMALLQFMEAEELIRPAEFEGEYPRLYERMNILGDNWINAASLFYPDDEAAIAHYHTLLFEVLYPYLTEKGKREYREVI